MNQTLRVAIIPPRHWWQTTRYRTEEAINLASIHVPAGFVTDGVTVSRWWVAAGLLLIMAAHYYSDWLYLLGILAVLLPALFPRVGLALKAAIVHDYLLDRGYERIYADRKFRQALRELGIENGRVNAMFYAVRFYSLLKYYF